MLLLQKVMTEKLFKNRIKEKQSLKRLILKAENIRKFLLKSKLKKKKLDQELRLKILRINF
jgi:hypothetical protein